MADAFSLLIALGPSSSGFRLSRLSLIALPARTLRQSFRYMPRTLACRVACAGVPAGSAFHNVDSLVILHSFVQFLPNRILASKRPRNRSEAFKNANSNGDVRLITHWHDSTKVQLESVTFFATTATIAASVGRKYVTTHRTIARTGARTAGLMGYTRLDRSFDRPLQSWALERNVGRERRNHVFQISWCGAGALVRAGSTQPFDILSFRKTD